jgi:hypothetical protein
MQALLAETSEEAAGDLDRKPEGEPAVVADDPVHQQPFGQDAMHQIGVFTPLLAVEQLAHLLHSGNRISQGLPHHPRCVSVAFVCDTRVFRGGVSQNNKAGIKSSTVDNPESGFPLTEQFLKVTGNCGDGSAVMQPNSCPDTKQVLKVTVLKNLA